MTPLRWRPRRRGGRLTGPRGARVDVSAHGGHVAWRGGALELGAALPAEGSTVGPRLVVDHGVRRARVVHVPHLTPTNEHVVGDEVFRSPAVLVADETLALAFIPDLDDVDAAEGHRTWLDYDHGRSQVTLAAGEYTTEGHVLFRRAPLPCRGQRVRLRLHVLASEAPEDVANPYGMAARFLWRRFGRAGHVAASRDAPRLEALLPYVPRWAFSDAGWGAEVWQELDLGGARAGAPAFIVDVTRHPSVPRAERTWREPRSIWNQAWFSTQRCANGLLRYARQTRDAELEGRARAMTEIALAAPEREGLFPSVLRCAEGDAGWERATWTNSDRRPPAASELACHLVDAATTSRALLEWSALTGEPRARARAVAFAERLVELQRPSGAFPGWVEPDGSVPGELAESAESAVGASLLLDLERMDLGGATFSAAARRALSFVEDVARQARWEDFETFYSCAPYGRERMGHRDERCGVFKQNTLSIFWSAELALAAGRLALARRCLDELSLYQAVWSPRFLLAAAHGGFGVMNADSEWSDARQSLFAPLYFDAFRAFGEAELLERGAAALRASLGLLYCPENARVARAYEQAFPFFGAESRGFMMENQGHAGARSLGTFTIYTWGPGSALAAIATVRDRHPDLYARAFAGG